MTKPVGRPKKKPKRQVPMKVEDPLADAIDDWVDLIRAKSKQDLLAAAILDFMLKADRAEVDDAMNNLVAWLKLDEADRPPTKIATEVSKSFQSGSWGAGGRSRRKA